MRIPKYVFEYEARAGGYLHVTCYVNRVNPKTGKSYREILFVTKGMTLEKLKELDGDLETHQLEDVTDGPENAR